MLRVLKRKTRSFIHYRSVQRFGVLSLGSAREVQPRVDATIQAFDSSNMAIDQDLNLIKGRPIDWSRRWSRRHISYVAFLDKEPLGYLWIGFDGWHVMDSDPSFPLPAGAAFLYDAITRTEWRGNRIYPAMISRAACDLRRRGFAELYLLADQSNGAAIAAPRHAGFRFSSYEIRLHRAFMIFRWRTTRPPALTATS